ncbi:hypothetical protein L596_028685 [Steinernema carpocapsae]|uniref:Uncharacterized protein n=1 Tax=Steinernema carpocapsae TaxID=34508 RepID=A0A4U5LZ78_STECR|nr:hypothetical protein L596_028685 [Steinernema carpocapsae]
MVTNNFSPTSDLPRLFSLDSHSGFSTCLRFQHAFCVLQSQTLLGNNTRKCFRKAHASVKPCNKHGSLSYGIPSSFAGAATLFMRMCS